MTAVPLMTSSELASDRLARAGLFELCWVDVRIQFQRPLPRCWAKAKKLTMDGLLPKRSMLGQQVVSHAAAQDLECGRRGSSDQGSNVEEAKLPSLQVLKEIKNLWSAQAYKEPCAKHEFCQNSRQEKKSEGLAAVSCRLWRNVVNIDSV